MPALTLELVKIYNSGTFCNRYLQNCILLLVALNMKVENHLGYKTPYTPCKICAGVLFHLYRADRSSKVGENRRTRRKTTWPSVSRTWLSHMWPERGSNHSGEKPNGLRVNSPIHSAMGARTSVFGETETDCITYRSCFFFLFFFCFERERDCCQASTKY